MNTTLPYRPCVGVVLANRHGRIFTGERIDTRGAWQMPQGGIDSGENPKEAALRELEEETGVSSNFVNVEAQFPGEVLYDLPSHLIGKLWKGRFRGQSQHWFLLRFMGADTDIRLEQKHPEFARWRWSTPDEVIRDIVPFKRDVYRKVIAEFRPHLELKS